MIFFFFLEKVEEMIDEVKFSRYVDTNEYVEAINLDDFIRRNYVFLFIIFS